MQAQNQTQKKETKHTAPQGLFGIAVSYTRIDEEGKMWIGNHEYETQVNYCPFTGEPAPKQMKLGDVELWDTNEDGEVAKKIFKQYIND